jgi:hypothetical protein
VRPACTSKPRAWAQDPVCCGYANFFDGSGFQVELAKSFLIDPAMSIIADHCRRAPKAFNFCGL